MLESTQKAKNRWVGNSLQFPDLRSGNNPCFPNLRACARAKIWKSEAFPGSEIRTSMLTSKSSRVRARKDLENEDTFRIKDRFNKGIPKSSRARARYGNCRDFP